MSTIHQDGHGHIAVQITGDHNDVTVSCGQLVLRLSAKHTRKRPPRTELDILRAEVRPLALLGRDAELASLQAWLDDPRPVLARGLIGPAGSGKTRLGIELSERAVAQGWATGFLDGGDLAAFVAAERTARWQPQTRLLVVIDYAARRARSLNAWLHGLARRAESERPRLRLLLLERHGSASEGWWAELRRLEGSDDALLDLLDPPEPTPLTPLTGLKLRRALLAGSMAESCRLAGRPPLAPPALGTDPAFDRRLAGQPAAAEPLYLMMAGLHAARHSLANLLALGRLDLALELACWERDRLRTLARNRDVPERMLLHLVACVTLQRGLPRKQRRALIERESEALHWRDTAACEPLADVLIDALPATEDGTTLRGIEPDLIGETLCLLLVTTDGELDAHALIDRCRKRAAVGTAQQLILTVQDFARPATELTHATAQPPRRPEAALLSGWLGAANPALAWLDHLVTDTADLEQLIDISDQMPHYTMLLRELAASVDQRVVDLLRPIATASLDKSLGSIFPVALQNLANRLRELGQREVALKTAQEALDLCRELAADRPDLFRPYLAMALNNVGSCLTELGQLEAALEAVREAVAIRRELEAAWPDAFRPSLASSLNNLVLCLSALGQHRAAQEAAQEAVDLYRELATARPDAFRPDLAMALNNFGNFLSELGQHADALKAAQEAVAIRRELAAARPDAFRPDLAHSLNNLSNRLSELGRREAALDTAHEAVGLYRELVAARPDAFRPNFTMALNNLANRLSALGQHAEALKAAQEAVGVSRTLAAAQPDAFRRNLAMALNSLANRLSALGLHEAALEVAQEAVDLYRELAAARPNVFRPNLAVSSAVLANCLEAMERDAEALATNREAIATLREPFLALPPAFAHWMVPMVQQYFARAQKLGVEPDRELLAPILAILVPRDSDSTNEGSPEP